MTNYIRTNRNLAVPRIETLKKLLDDFFSIDHNITIKDGEIIFTEE